MWPTGHLSKHGNNAVNLSVTYLIISGELLQSKWLLANHFPQQLITWTAWPTLSTLWHCCSISYVPTCSLAQIQSLHRNYRHEGAVMGSNAAQECDHHARAGTHTHRTNEAVQINLKNLQDGLTWKACKLRRFIFNIILSSLDQSWGPLP